MDKRFFGYVCRLGGAMLVLSGCGGDKSDENVKAPVVAPELKNNQLADAPSSLLQRAASSDIHWQIWEPALLKRAADAQRLIYALITSSRYPSTDHVLAELEKRASVVNRLNTEFVPVLVDLDICREASLVATVLSAEIGIPVDFPCVLILSPAGDPVSWQPLGVQGDQSVQNYFENTLDVVSRLWGESPKYVLADSGEKNDLRRKRLGRRQEAVKEPAERLRFYRASLRKLTSQFDADLGSLSGVGGVFPSSAIYCLATAAVNEQLDADIRRRAAMSASSMLRRLSRSAMVDPLDGGIFSARYGPSWQLPIFDRNGSTQAQAIRALALSSIHLDDTPALDMALGATKFVEAQYMAPGGLFTLASHTSASASSNWMWEIEVLEKVLSKEEYQVWDALSAFNSLGNLPGEADPLRRHFRLNSLAFRKTPEEVAKQLGLDENRVRILVESGRKKLLEARAERLQRDRLEPVPSASASFQMISAYAALYAATGDSAWRDKAIELGQSCREQFGQSRFLNELSGEKASMMSDARAHAYAVATRAAVDLGSVTLDDSWYLWAQDLMTLMGENFVSEDGNLTETREVARVIRIPFSDRSMMFEESTLGLTVGNLHRLAALDFQIPPALEPLMYGLPPSPDMPVVFTDLLLGLAFDMNHRKLEVPSGVGAALIDAVTRLPTNRFARRTSSDPGSSVRLTDADGATRKLETAAQIEALVEPLVAADEVE